MMSGMPLETWWAFNKFWNNKFYYKVATCWLFLLIHTTMHGSINIKNEYQIKKIWFKIQENSINLTCTRTDRYQIIKYSRLPDGTYTG